jgi:hypothetical protein
VRTPVLPSLAILALMLAHPARAAAGWFTGTPVGPAGVTHVGGLDLARDGTGGVAWVSGGALGFSALAHGRFSAPAPVAAGAPLDASAPVLAAGRDGALAVAWNSSGRVYAAYRPPGKRAFDASVLVWAGRPAAGPPALDLAGRQKALLAFSAGGDVHAETLIGGSWHLVPGVLDAVPAQVAGAGANRPAVAMSTDGTGIVTWGEAGQIEVRRVRGISASVAVADAGAGDSPLVGTGDDDSLALVAWRAPGGVEAVRRLRGGVLDPGTTIAAGGPAALTINGRGAGLLAASSAGGTGLTLAPIGGSEKLGEPRELGAGSLAAVAGAEHVYAFAAWLDAAGQVSAARRSLTTLGPITPLTAPALGAVTPAGGLLAAADATGDALVTWIQTVPGAASRLVVGGFARTPAPPTAVGPRAPVRESRPILTWTASRSPWVSRYELVVDGAALGATARTSLRSPRRLRDGRHRVRVVAIDEHGRRAASRAAALVVDTRPPAVSVSGTPGAKRVRVRVRAADGSGSGVVSLRVTWGDGARTVTRTAATHVLRGAGSFTVRVTARDRAGNVRTVRRTFRIGA